MSKGPILLLGAAAVAGIAIAMHSKAQEQSSAAPAAPKGTSAKDLTAAQKSKLETWAKGKGIPVDKAYDLARSLYGMKF